MTLRLTRRGLIKGASATALGMAAASFPAPGLIRSARAEKAWILFEVLVPGWL